MEKKIKDLLLQMTAEEKLDFCAGDDTWHTHALPRLGIPALTMHDGPHGLRIRTKQADGRIEQLPATCFPTASAMANSWNPELITVAGRTIADECRAQNTNILLGPGVNIKRSPLCGRNFEYYSEDPYLAGKCGAAFIRGVQSRGVAACVKHFCVNNQETRRFSTDARVSPRALHEIYLTPFEIAVREGKVQTVMHAYNRVNGSYVGEDAELLRGILRDKWGFDGYVMSDWFATDDHAAAVAAGTNVEMPPCADHRAALADAYARGEITDAMLDEAVADILRVAFRHTRADASCAVDEAAHRAAAQRVAEECMVLLKNEGGMLPLAKGEPLAVLGSFVKTQHRQGQGSSYVKPTAEENFFTLLAAANGGNIRYADGYDENGATDEQIAEAVRAAKDCGRVLAFVGLPAGAESENFDRKHLRLPDAQLRVLDAVLAACDRVCIVVTAGAPVELPFAPRAAAIFCTYFSGQTYASAAVRLLYGEVNPSGKLAETWPLRLADTPAYPFFPGDGDTCFYGEDIFVGYRHYDTRKLDVRYPFGHGLSYTTFAYTGIEADRHTVRVTVKNTGDRCGKETVQLYASALPHPAAAQARGIFVNSFVRPTRWLCGFEKAELAPGEEATVTFTLDDRAFSVYDEAAGDFRVIGGNYVLSAGGSSRDLPLSAVITVEEDMRFLPTVDKNTAIETLLFDTRIPRDAARTLLKKVLPTQVAESFFADAGAVVGSGSCSYTNPVVRHRANYVLRQFLWWNPSLTAESLQDAIDEINRAIRAQANK